MNIRLEPKEIVDAYSTPIVQQTSFWPKVKEQLGMNSCAFDYSVRNSDLYAQVGGYAYTQADFIMFFRIRYLENKPFLMTVLEVSNRGLNRRSLAEGKSKAHSAFVATNKKRVSSV